MLETELLTEVCRLADELQIRWFHIPDSRKLRGTPGIGYPDLTLVGSHGLAFAELKSGSGTESPEQVTWRYQLQAAGQTVWLWRPAHLWSGRIEQELASLNTAKPSMALIHNQGIMTGNQITTTINTVGGL